MDAAFKFVFQFSSTASHSACIYFRAPQCTTCLLLPSLSSAVQYSILDRAARDPTPTRPRALSLKLR